MSPEISERAFEEAIECGLLQYGPDACAGDSTAVREPPPPYGDTPPGGYRRRRPEDYDRALCLLPRDVVDFVLATQPKEWTKLEQHHGAAVREQFLKRLAAEIERRRLLPADRETLPREVQQNIDMESYRIQQTGSGKIALERKPGVLDPAGSRTPHGTAPEEMETLSRIIAELNERFELYRRITDDRTFGEAVKNFLFDQYLRAQRSPEPVFLKWKALDATAQGDFFVRSGPGTVKLTPDSAREYIRTRFGTPAGEPRSDAPSKGAV